MNLRGKLYAEAPIYRGNGRKTLFTRDGDGKQRMVSLAGEIAGTAQSLMDAFIGQSANGRNIGLLQKLWERLYDNPMPSRLIGKVECRLQEESYPTTRFFDLRMGLKLDEDRWAAESNANYKFETLLRHSVFDISFQIDDYVLNNEDNASKLYYLLEEMAAGRFWFGAGKSKGLGRCRLEIALPFKPAATAPTLSRGANHLTITCGFDASNPILVGWNWGKIDPTVPAFAAVEGKVLLEAMYTIPLPIRKRLEMTIGGPLLSPEDWKRKLANFLPRVTAIWLREQSAGESESWILPVTELVKLGKDKKYPLSQKIIASVQGLTDIPFDSKEAAEAAIVQALGGKSNMTSRITGAMVRKKQAGHKLNRFAWQEAANGLNLDPALGDHLDSKIGDEHEFVATLNQAFVAVMPGLHQQVDRQVRLLRSDNWVDVEVANRQQHLKIKEMLRDGKIAEQQWGNYNQVPEGVQAGAWREFIDGHARVRFQHMLNAQNLNKSITNDRNFIEFLQKHRERTRQELVQPIHTEFRANKANVHDVAQRYGHNYDTIFMRMLTWKPSNHSETAWEVYIPGGTLKGAFRKRASQVLKTLWGEGERAQTMLDLLFGKQGQVGRVFFSDAYLVDPENTARSWCSMDGIRVDPKTGEPMEGAKLDFLYAYGEQLKFSLRLDFQDLGPDDLDAYSLLQHLLLDFQRGDIPLGGDKGTGFGWVCGMVNALDWMSGSTDGATAKLFPNQPVTRNGLWQMVALRGEQAAQALKPAAPVAHGRTGTSKTPPKAQAGFISHRAFGGYCGTLFLEAEVLRPLHIQESGQPSYTATVGGTLINGWDTFSMSPPDLELRPESRVYAIPSRTLRGAIRHIYAIASDSKRDSRDLSSLNPVDSLFGWVGNGPNQSVMGRVSFSFGQFAAPQTRWFTTPPFYGKWRYTNGKWSEIEEQKADRLLIANTWRIFPHATLAPIVSPLSSFHPEDANADYFNTLLPGSKARFSVRFWNLEESELQRLVWSLTLENGLAHKLGKHRYVGFGSVRMTILPESHLVDWAGRYTSAPKSDGAAQDRLPFDVTKWHNPVVVQYLPELRAGLDAQGL